MMNSWEYAQIVSDVKGALSPAGTRSYNSPVRDESARRTRLRIITAAHPLLLERGFAQCSVTDIAAAAGVARPTVLTVFGTKANLLHAVVDHAMAGDDEPTPVAEHPWFLPVFAATSQGACLDAYAHVCLLIARRSAAVIELVRRASDASSEISDLWDQLQRNRRAGAAMVVQQLREIGPLSPGLTTARATDAL